MTKQPKNVLCIIGRANSQLATNYDGLLLHTTHTIDKPQRPCEDDLVGQMQPAVVK